MQVYKIDENIRTKWDHWIEQFPESHPFNFFGWGKVRKIDGWQATYLVGKDEQSIRGMIMILVKKIPFTGLSIMYAPKGPLCEIGDRLTIKTLLKAVKAEAKKQRSIFLRIEPNRSEGVYQEKDDPFVAEGFLRLKQRWSFWNSPRDVYRIDLNNADSSETLFKQLDRDTRRCIRKAKKEGVEISHACEIKELKEFYTIFSDFTAQKGFMCRRYEYQEALWKEYLSKGYGKLFLCKYKEKIIGGLLCITAGKKCVAMHMGTPPQYKKLQTYYAYVWESIRWAKENGCVWYSFRGVGTTPSQERFKRKFNPRAVSLVGYYDYPFIKPLYKIFFLCEFTVFPKVFHELMDLRRLLINTIKGYHLKLKN